MQTKMHLHLPQIHPGIVPIPKVLRKPKHIAIKRKRNPKVSNLEHSSGRSGLHQGSITSASSPSFDEPLGFRRLGHPLPRHLRPATTPHLHHQIRRRPHRQPPRPDRPYKLSDRATKYGILFILLTFGGFFLFEILKHLPIHPIQYLLVGFGLAIFFLLLISFSEHLPFALAYLLSSAACIGLLTFYLAYVLRSLTRGLTFGTMLTTLYAAVYGLLISEDNALILGSLLLFTVLATIMVITRRIDWYKTTPTPPTPPTTNPIPPPQGFRFSE